MQLLIFFHIFITNYFKFKGPILYKKFKETDDAFESWLVGKIISKSENFFFYFCRFKASAVQYLLKI